MFPVQDGCRLSCDRTMCLEALQKPYRRTLMFYNGQHMKSVYSMGHRSHRSTSIVFSDAKRQATCSTVFGCVTPTSRRSVPHRLCDFRQCNVHEEFVRG